MKKKTADCPKCGKICALYAFDGFEMDVWVCPTCQEFRIVDRRDGKENVTPLTDDQKAHLEAFILKEAA